MKQKLLAWAVVGLVAATVLTPVRASATFHFMLINEVYVGSERMRTRSSSS